MRDLDQIIDAILCCPKCGERWSSANLKLCLRCAPVAPEPPNSRAVAEPKFAAFAALRTKRTCVVESCNNAAVLGPYCYAHTLTVWGYRP